MIRTMMNGKIHRAVVTEANLNYVGSITIDPVLLEAANILPNELVQIVNNNNGERLETYVIEGERGSGEVCLNGAAARKVQVGDVVIIISYVQLDERELDGYEPNVVIVDQDNNIVDPEYIEKRQTEYTHQ
ncbi:aspartate 1-decarboxylase [Salinicoccus roseus]|uniref:Aspartate 1-decarboxylase n=1 Tax=Salinicoccus roseus TaxID=45670 RepID=A0A265E9N0_9STAP|nr:aspartate 1-decarboxylase [Salinicoccus roseus]MBY8910370.1 aspartate 1-decarboxylase [Salinicoccus roseus]OZT78299.1 aspartate 1-decarboxylase [Salinicoccus roseus]GGA65938.1 aspartate 1-decarboxylase [Salinicoccus roseus]